MEINNIDLVKWEKLVQKLQIDHCIYPGRSAIDADYRRVADLLNDLLKANFQDVPDMINDFYLLARGFALQFDTSRRDSEEGDPWIGYKEGDRFYYPEFAKFTRNSLGLTRKILREVPGGIDKKEVVDFFNSLFRHCPIGYFLITKVKDTSDPLSPFENFWFNIEKGFDQVADFIVGDPGIREKWSWQAYHFVFSSPIQDLKTVAGCANLVAPNIKIRPWLTCLFCDVDNQISDLEETLLKYKVTPSIRVKTSPRGWHFYWILKNPLSFSGYYSVVDCQAKLCKLVGGDFGRADADGCARIPGLFNFSYSIPHYISCDYSGKEYELKDFLNLPYGLVQMFLDSMLGKLKE